VRVNIIKGGVRLFKRIISQVLIMTMLFTAVLPLMGIGNLQVSADSDSSNTVHFRLNFDQYPTTASLSNPAANALGEVGGAWSLFGTAAGTDYAIGQLDNDHAGQYFTMVSNGQNVNIQKNNLTLPGNADAKTFIMNGKFKFNTTTHERRLFQTTVTNAPATTTVGTYILIADTAGKLKIQYPTTTGTQTTEISDYAANQWYDVELAFDLIDRNLHIFIDGEEFEQSIDIGNTWNNFSSTRFVQIGKAGTEGQFSMDDIVYHSSTLTYDELYGEPSESPEPSPTIHPDFDRTIVRDTYLYMNFDQYALTPSITAPSGNIGGNWGVSNTAANTDYFIGAEASDGDGRYITYYSTTGKNISLTRYNQSIPSVKSSPVTLVIEGKYLVNSINTERRLFEATLNHKTDTSVSRTLSVSMDNTGNFKVSYPKLNAATGNDTLTFGTYEINEWYHVQAYIDWHTYQLSVYVNGEKLLSNLEIGSNWNNVKDMRITQIGKAGETVTFSIDDFLTADFVPLDSMNLLEAAEVIRLIPTEERQLTVSYAPLAATNKYVDWSSSDSAVAEVDQSGKITAISEGIATITVTSKEDNRLSDEITIEVKNYTPLTGLSISPSTVSVETERTTQLQAEYIPADATNKDITWSSSDDAVAMVDHNGLVTGISEGTAIITAISEEGSFVGTSTVTVVPRYTAVEDISLPATAKMYSNDSISFTAIFSPRDATNQQLRWESSDPSLATVDQTGRVYAGNDTGLVTITAYSLDSQDEIFAAAEVQIIERGTSNPFDEMRSRWKTILDGGESLDVDNLYVIDKTEAINNIAQSLWKRMIKEEQRVTLWEDLLPSTTDSSVFNSYFTRLRDMSYAYSTKGGELYHNQTLKNDIISALDWLYEHQYNEDVAVYGNWWNFEIGAPQRIMDIFTLLYDELDEEMLNQYFDTVTHFIGDISLPSFDATGANRSDILTIIMLMAIMSENEELLEEAINQLSPLFEYVSSGDGFYEDGSFIQHSIIPYTGSYGEVLIRGLGQILYLIADSPFEVTDPKVNHIYRWVYETVQPIVYAGETMDMVRGRAIARERNSGHITTIGLLSGVMRIALASPPQEQLILKRLVKQWLEAMPTHLNYYRELKLDLIAPIESLMNDPTIEALPISPLHHEFGAMNRTIHIREDFAVAISKSSNRIATYELTNGENGEGWYTSDGMLYLYNGDKEHYGGDYWATVNRYRLPGTTVDTRERTNTHYQYGDGETTPSNEWAGGVTLGDDGISGMQLQQVGTTLKANKSWFMFGDVIVSLGSGITSNDQRTIETIIEQRKLNADGSNQFIVNGITMSDALGWGDDLTDVEWAHLTGTNDNANIGYYFIDGEDIIVERKAQSGTWYQINQNAGSSADERTDNYLTMYIDHGANPVNKKYGYVLLPNYSVQETQQFANQPSIEIIEHSDDIHAVKDQLANQIAVNFYKDGIQTVDAITVNRQAAIMVKENNETLEVAVADPTFNNTGTIEVELDYSAAAILDKDPEIVITQLTPTIKFMVNTDKSLSKSFYVTFDLDEASVEGPLPALDWSSPTTTKQALLQDNAITYVTSTFDKERSGDAPKQWLITRDENTSASIVTDQLLTDKHVRLVDINTNGVITAAHEFEEQSNYFQLEWNVAALTDNSEWHAIVTGKDGVAAQLIYRNQSLYYVDVNSSEQLITSVDARAWLSAQLNVNVREQYWDLLLDGNIVLMNIPFTEEVESINQLQFATGLATAETVMYVDDVAVYMPGAISIFTDDFEEETEGEHPVHWVVTEVDLAPVYVITEGGLNKSLIIDDNTNRSSNLYYEFSTEQDEFVVEWDFKEMSGGKYPEFQLRSDTTSAIRFSSSSNNYFRYYAQGASANSTLTNAPTKNNVWQHVKVVVNTTAQTYSMYFNSVLVLQDEPFYNSVSSISRLYFASGYGAADAPLYIDNVKIYTFDEKQPEWDTESELEVANVTDTTASISWEHALDESGIAQYELYVNNETAEIISGLSTSWVLEDLEPESEYAVQLFAIDHMGFRSELPLEASFTTLAPPVDPGPVDPGPVDPGPVDPGPVDPGPVDPGPADPGPVDPGPVDPGPVDPGPANPGPGTGSGTESGTTPEEENSSEESIIINDKVDLDQLKQRILEAVDKQGSGTNNGETQGSSNSANFNFTDVDGHWSETVVKQALSLGLVNGYGDGSFKPNGVITRAEFSTMITKVFGISATASSNSFVDVNNHWAKSAIDALANAGIVGGYGDGTFAPDKTITREEMIIIISRIVNLQAAAKDTTKGEFSDLERANSYAVEAIKAAAQAGIINGKPNNSFDPQGQATRAEALTIIMNVVKLDVEIAALLEQLL